MHWRTHPSLKGKLHPEHPDDLQVIVHDGGPRLTQLHPEAVWVIITSFDDGLFSGRVLNTPTQLKSIQRDQTVRFLSDSGSPHPVMVTDKYLRERAHWKIGPCTTCGFAELFDAPSDLIRATFPNMPADAELEAFSAFCPLCGGVQTIESRKPQATAVMSPWWKFWARK